MLQKRFMAIAGLSFIRLNTKIGALFLWKSAARTDKKTALPYGRADFLPAQLICDRDVAQLLDAVDRRHLINSILLNVFVNILIVIP